MAKRLFQQEVNWFPGHMHKALRQLESKISQIDILLEVRDARLPYSTRNFQFDQIIRRAQKQKIIIFNKFDVCDQTKTGKIIKDYQSIGIKCHAVSAQTHTDMRVLLDKLKIELPPKYKTVGLWMQICGMPNVGKSTIINQIRTISDLQNKKAIAKATASVCTTKGRTPIRIFQQPLCYLVDSPGVMIPSNISDDIGVKLGLMGIIKQTIIQRQTLIDFMIQLLQRDDNKKYYQALGLPKPTSGIEYLLSVRKKFGFYNYDAAYDHILDCLRTGKFGNLTLDKPQDIQDGLNQQFVQQ